MPPRRKKLEHATGVVTMDAARWQHLLRHGDIAVDFLDHRPNDLPDEMVREAWQFYRDEINSTLHPGNGQRWWCWWKFEASEPRDESEPEIVQLARIGELRQDEAETLLEQAWARRLTAAEVAACESVLAKEK